MRRTKRWRRSSSALFVLLVVMVACTGSADDEPRAETPPATSEPALEAEPRQGPTNTPPDGLPATEQLAMLREEGASDVEIALAELTAYVGPLPGATTVTYDDSLHPSLTGPLATLGYSWDDLTDEQIAEVSEALEPWFSPGRVLAAYDSSGNDITVTAAPQRFSQPAAQADPVGPECSSEVVASTTTAPILEAWRQEAIDASVFMATDFPGELDFVVMLVDTPEEDPIFWDFTTYAAASPGVWPELAACYGTHDCYIQINSWYLSDRSAGSTIAHELFHCWHAAHAGLDRFNSTPDWVIEGLAEWVGETYRSSFDGRDNWVNYARGSTSDPGRYNLFGASYSAFGFWAFVDNHADLASFIPHLVRDPNIEAGDLSTLRLVVDEIGDEAAATVASSATMRTALGDEWTTTGPWNLATSSRDLPEVDLTTANSVELRAPAGVQLTREVNIVRTDEEDLVVAMRLSDSGIVEWSDGSRTFAKPGVVASEVRCIGECVCEDGTPIPTTLPNLRSASPSFFVALSGVIASAAELSVDVTPLSSYCGPEDPETTPANEPSRAGSYGHPNLVTFDGVAYIFHGAGDYALVESTTDDLEIHVRYSRLNNMTGVSFNRAVAARVGQSVVTFGDDADSTAFDPAIIRLDGEIVGRDALPIDIDGGASLSTDGERFVLTLADGTELRVGTRVGDQIDVLMSDDRWGDVVGLLGNANGQLDDDVVTRTGEVVDPHEFDDFYARFGSSWLLDVEDSLFESDLDPGDTEPIVPSARVTLADLSPEARAEAEAVCRAGGVRPGFGLAECIFDVAMTGDSSWIRSVLAMTEIIDEGVSVAVLSDEIETETDVAESGTYDGLLSASFAVDRFVVDLSAGESMSITGLTCTDLSTFQLALISPSGFVVDRSRGDDCGELTLRSAFEPGDHQVLVYDTGGFAGPYELDLAIGEVGAGDLVDFETQFDIRVGYADAEPAISFLGRAGDRLKFSHPPDVPNDGNLGFGSYHLIGPDGSILERWSLRDDRELTIASDGVYTLRVDLIVGVEPGSVTLEITSDGGSRDVQDVRFGEPFTMDVIASGHQPVVRFEASAGDNVLITNEAPDEYFPAAATLTAHGPDGAELAWWFSGRDGELEIPIDGSYTIIFDPGSSDLAVPFDVLIEKV